MSGPEQGSQPGARSAPRRTWQRGSHRNNDDLLVEECAVALVYNDISHVVMMATPTDLRDFALGFSLSEGILAAPAQLLDFEVVDADNGLELRMQITAEPFQMLKQRRRNLEGRTGCGLCGAESLAQAIREPQQVSTSLSLAPEAIDRALGQLQHRQPLRQATGAAHAAAWCSADGEVVLVREDVGRHNALDKLLGALWREGFDSQGFVLVTSRASYELVMKTASADIPALVAVSAPTSMAVDYAQGCGIALYGFAADGRHSHY